MSEKIESLKAALFELEKEKEACLNDIQEAVDYLMTTPAGLHGRLIDDEGFPRADCDLYAVRTARNKYSCRTNDLKDVETKLYNKLIELQSIGKDEALSQMRNQQQSTVSDANKEFFTSNTKNGASPNPIHQKAPFLTVVEVKMNSPSFDGGLREGQCVVQYGEVDSSYVTKDWKRALASCTVENIPVSVWDTDSSRGNRGVVYYTETMGW